MPLEETPYQNTGLRFLKSQIVRQDTHHGGEIDLIGIPFDGASSYGVGSRFGPDAVRKLSAMLTDGCHPDFEVDPSTIVVDHGDVIVGTDINLSLFKIMMAIGQLIKRAATPEKVNPIFSIGGDHLVTLGILRGMQEHPRYTPDMKLLIFDAHCDTWEQNFGLKYGHGTWVRNVVEEGIVKPHNIKQVGLRSNVDPKTKRWLTDQQGVVTSVASAARHPETFIQGFSRHEPLYVSIDIDVLDPAFAPGTGTPEAGGLTSAELISIVEKHVSYENLLGADLVEVSPPYDDRREVTSMTAARVLYGMMSAYMASQSPAQK